MSQINVITGPNGNGKTSLLEALWVFHGRYNPGNFWSPTIARGISPLDVHPYKAQARIADNPIVISGVESGIDCSLTIKGLSSASVPIPKNPTITSGSTGTSGMVIDLQSQQPQFSDPTPDTFMQIEHSMKDGHNSPRMYTTKLRLTGADVHVEIDPQLQPFKRPNGIYVFPTTGRGIGNDTVDRFSNLIRRGSDHKSTFISAMKLIEPRLVDINVASINRFPRLFATLNDNSILPIELLGGGLGRYAAIYLCLFDAQDGVIAIDEIEAGIHHLALTGFWKTLVQIASQLNVQVFAATHSRECILAMVEATHDYSSKVTLHRLYRKNQDAFIENYNSNDIVAALEGGSGLR